MLIRLVVLLLFFAGAGLFYKSATMVYYKNIAKKDSLDMQASEAIFTNHNVENSQKAKEHYFREVEKLRTNKAFYEDLGSGVMVATFTILVFLLSYGVKSVSNLKKIVSFNKVWVFVSATISWLLLIPGIWWYYVRHAERGNYPSWSDTIAIPIMSGTIAVIFGAIILVTFMAISSIGSKFPAPVFILPYRYDIRNIIREILWASLVVFNLFSTYFFIIDGDHITIFVSLFLLYILLMIRAGQFHKQNTEHQNDITLTGIHSEN